MLKERIRIALNGWKIEREKGIFGHGGVALSWHRQKCAGKRIFYPMPTTYTTFAITPSRRDA